MSAAGVLRLIRRLAFAGVALSVGALPLGMYSLVSALSPDVGDNGMGDTLAITAGITLLALGVSGLVLGVALAILAKRALPDQVDIVGSRRAALVAGLTIAGLEVVVAAAVAGGWLLNATLIAALAAGFVFVAVASRGRVDTVLAGALAVGLLTLGALPLSGQASQNDAGARRAERVALLPAEWQAAVGAAAAAAPDGWSAATLTARVTDYAPSKEAGVLPASLVGRELRGILVVDCAGAERLDVAGRDPDAPAYEAPVVLGAIPCRAEPEVVSIEIPALTVHTNPSATYVLGIDVDPVNEGPAGGMYRAVLLVALTDTPEPERDALLETFDAAFGTEAPR